MAQRVVTELTDDLDGTTIENGAGETVTFALDGTSYEIDLSAKNAEKMRKAFQTYIDGGRKVGGGTSRRGRPAAATKSSTADAKAIRAWAVEQGIEMSARGRIPSEVAEQYRAALNG
jgi:hypothetical protein